MNEQIDHPIQMQSENPTLGYYFYDPVDPSEVSGAAEVAAAEVQMVELATKFVQFLGQGLAQAADFAPLIVSSEALEPEEIQNFGAQDIGSRQEEEATEPIVVYPSHAGVYFPSEYFTDENDANAKVQDFFSTREGRKFAAWKLERDIEAYVSQETLMNVEEINVDEIIRDAQESTLSPGALATVQVYPHLLQVLAQPLWPYGKGEGVKVAVLDTGLDLGNALLTAGSIGGVSYVPGRPSYYDDHGHGTHVTGIIAARPGIHSSGRRLYWSIAPSASHYTIKVLNGNGSGNFSWIARGIDRARVMGVDIINMSLGSSQPTPVVVQRAIRLAAQQQVIIAAAGNSGPGADTVGYPARYREVIGVGAVDSNRNIAEFSSRGPRDPRAFVEDYVECVAPGVNIYSCKLGGGANTLVRMSGTSMATPVVSGICALLKQKDRSLSGLNTFRYRLRRSYIDLGISGPDNWYGLGQVFFYPRS